MPKGDGTGPPWRKNDLGAGRGGGRRGSRMGRMGGVRAGAGPGGECICPKCETTVAHEAGTPCSFVRCPQCGSPMVRK